MHQGRGEQRALCVRRFGPLLRHRPWCRHRLGPEGRGVRWRHPRPCPPLPWCWSCVRRGRSRWRFI